MRLVMNTTWPVPVYEGTDRLFLTALGPEISTAAIAYAPKKTGDLARSIEFHLAGHSLIIAAHAPYAAYVELGTRPHPINSKGPWSLHNAETGQYFGRHVHHPGTKPEPYLRPALYQVRAAA